MIDVYVSGAIRCVPRQREDGCGDDSVHGDVLFLCEVDDRMREKRTSAALQKHLSRANATGSTGEYRIVM